MNQIATTKAVENRIAAQIDTSIEGDILAGTDLTKTQTGGQVTINHSITGASSVNNSNGTGISIEITGIPKEEAEQPGKWYTEVMYENLAFLVANICKRNQIAVDRTHIFGHDEMTMRKSDPGTLIQNLSLIHISEPTRLLTLT